MLHAGIFESYAIDRGYDAVVLLDPDRQYPEMTPPIHLIEDAESRMLDTETAGGPLEPLSGQADVA